MSLIGNFNRIFDDRPKAFLVDENIKELAKDVKMVESMNVSVDTFTDCKNLLYTLQSTRRKKYTIGIIKESGNKYTSQILSSFIKKIDPTIKLIFYNDSAQLKKETQILTLTA